MAAALPITNGRHRRWTLSLNKALAVTSGPMPAGSPIVMAMYGFAVIADSL